MNTVYKCLAFEDYMGNKDDEFENFVKEYEKHL